MAITTDAPVPQSVIDEIAASEAAVWRGEHPQRPFVLVGQQYLADPTRSRGSLHPLWAYAHVPHGYTCLLYTSPSPRDRG